MSGLTIFNELWRSVQPLCEHPLPERDYKALRLFQVNWYLSRYVSATPAATPVLFTPLFNGSRKVYRLTRSNVGPSAKCSSSDGPSCLPIEWTKQHGNLLPPAAKTRVSSHNPIQGLLNTYRGSGRATKRKHDEFWLCCKTKYLMEIVIYDTR